MLPFCKTNHAQIFLGQPPTLQVQILLHRLISGRQKKGKVAFTVPSPIRTVGGATRWNGEPTNSLVTCPHSLTHSLTHAHLSFSRICKLGSNQSPLKKALKKSDASVFRKQKHDHACDKKLTRDLSSLSPNSTSSEITNDSRDNTS